MNSKRIIKEIVPPLLIRFVRRMRLNTFANINSSQEFWTKHNVTTHMVYRSAEESLSHFLWRNTQYFDYLKFMPVDQASGKVVLDYGCGPGHDLAGFAHYSKPQELIGMDISSTSLDESMKRMKLHQFPVHLIHIDENTLRLPLDDRTVDIIHSSGVLHHTPDPVAIMREFRRILKPDGHIQVMVYNYDSIWMHLLNAYIYMIDLGAFSGLSKREAFSRTTDGPDCPIAECYKPEDFIKMAGEAGLRCELSGVAISTTEMTILPRRFEAISDMRLDSESRDFLCDLEFNSKGIPLYQGRIAGLDACFRLYPG